MRIASLERVGRIGASGVDVEVVGFKAVSAAESLRRHLDAKKEEELQEQNLTLETIWMR